jgi:hypothetical protein
MAAWPLAPNDSRAEAKGSSGAIVLKNSESPLLPVIFEFVVLACQNDNAHGGDKAILLFHQSRPEVFIKEFFNTIGQNDQFPPTNLSHGTKSAR